ncbi:MAG: hypothetical protein RLZ97_1940 [Verrucomicrobiota bacterium]
MSLLKEMMRAPLILFSLLFLSCADKPEEGEKAPTAPRLIGRVASVHAKEGFVLIEGYGEVVPAAGLLVTTQGEGRAATLSVTGERSGRYAAADIKGGEVAVGDAAYGRPVRDESTDSQAPTPTTADGEISKKADDQALPIDSNRDGTD